MSEKIADELHAFIAAAPHKYPGHLIELFDRAEKALRRCSADSAQPEVWMWRATVGGVWGSWRLLDQPIDEFKKSAWGFNLGNGTAEVRALYARPERTEPQTAPVRDEIAKVAFNLAEAVECSVDLDLHPLLKKRVEATKSALKSQHSQAVSAPLASNASDPLETLEGNCWDLRCIDIPTGGGDADIGWNIVEHHMGPPKERIVGRGRSPREALQDATSTLSRPQCEGK